MASKKPSLCGNSVSGVVLTGAGDDDGDDKTVDTEDTSHDDGDNVTHDLRGLHNTHGHEADARLGGTVGRAKVGEDQGRGHSHPCEEEGRRIGGEEREHLALQNRLVLESL